MKRIVAGCMAMLMALSMTACGSTSSNTNSAATTTADSTSAKKSGGVTLEVWESNPTSDAQRKVIQEQVAKYEAASGNKVNLTDFSYDMLHDKLLSAAAGGNTPDLVWGLPEWVSEFYKMGILEDLTSRYKTWNGVTSLSDAVVKAMTVDNKIVGVPYEMTVRGYLVHKDLLTKGGTTVPKTWSDVLAMSGFKSKTGVYPYGFAATSARAPQELLVYLAQEGLQICDAQSDGKYKNTWKDNTQQLKKAAEVFQFYKDCVDKGVVDPNSKSWGYQQTDDNFVTGLTATYVTGNWLQQREATNPTQMKDVAVEPIPYPADGKPATYMECKPLFIFNTSKNKDAAFDLATTVCAKDWQSAVYADASPMSEVKTDSKWSKDFSKLADTGVSFPPVVMGGVTQAMIDSIAKVLQEGKTPTETAQWLSDAVNASLKDSGDLSAS